MQEVYRVSPRVSSETIAGEVMILDLDTGNYFNLSESGAAIWELLKSGAKVSEIVECLTARFEGESKRIFGAVEKLLAEFKEDRLISAIPDDSGRGRPELPSNVAREPFTDPVFNKFTDLKDLLLVDPIHEVDHAGWPRKT